MRTQIPLLASLLLLPALAGLATVSRAGEDASAKPGAEEIVGAWHLLTSFRGQELTSRLTIARGADGALEGTYVDARGRASEVDALTWSKGRLSFSRRVPGPGGETRTIRFEAQLEGGRLEGHHLLGAREIPVVGILGKDAFEAFLAKRRKANERTDDLEADYDKHARRAAPRDAFPVLFDPPLTPAAKAADIRDDEPVIGVALGDEAQAYPISIMGVHELANNTCGGRPIAASW